MAMVNIRIDDVLKTKGEEVFRELNVSATEAITKLYRYAAEYRRLPFDDPGMILCQMRDAIDKAADIALRLNIQHAQKGYISASDRDTAQEVFDGTVRSLEANYSALRAACGGYLQQVWLNAANAMKGLLWMLTMCTEEVQEGVTINAELSRAVQALSDSYIGISLISEQFSPRN